MDRNKRILILLGAVVVLGAIVYASLEISRSDEVVVQTAKVERREVLESVVSASGDIRAKEFVDLQSEIDGIVIDLPVEEGDQVQKGDVLLRIDPIRTEAETSSSLAQYEGSLAEARSQEFQILTAESNLARDQAAVRSAEAELEQSRSNHVRVKNSFDRKQQLHEEGLISREDYEIAQNELHTTETQLKVAEARLAQMQTQVDVAKVSIDQMKAMHSASRSRARSMAANLTRAKDQLQKTTLYSPLSGVITQLLVEQGERAVPGIMSNPQATLMTIADLSVIQAELRVDETDIVDLSLGNPASVKIDALPDELHHGKVTEIGNSPIQTTTSSQQEAKDFKVIITLDNPSPKLRPGMSCTGDVTTERKENVLVIPIQALTIREVEVDEQGNYQPERRREKSGENIARADSGGDKNNKRKKKELEGVFVVSEDRKARFRPVKTGITGESDIEITGNLEEGEEIVSGSFQTLRTIEDATVVEIDNRIRTRLQR